MKLNQSDLIKMGVGGAVGYLGASFLIPKHPGFAKSPLGPTTQDTVKSVLGHDPPPGTRPGNYIDWLTHGGAWNPNNPINAEHATGLPSIGGNKTGSIQEGIVGIEKGAGDIGKAIACPPFMGFLGKYCEYWPMILLGSVVGIMILAR